MHVSLFLNYFIYIHIPAGSFPRVLLSVYKLTVGRHPAVFSLRWCRSHVNWKPPDVFHGKPSDGQIFTLETRACEPWKWFARLTPDFILNKVQGSKHFGSLPWKWSEKSCLKNKCSCSWASLKHMFVVEMQDVWKETSCAKTSCLLEGYHSHYGKVDVAVCSRTAKDTWDVVLAIVILKMTRWSWSKRYVVPLKGDDSLLHNFRIRQSLVQRFKKSCLFVTCHFISLLTLNDTIVWIYTCKVKVQTDFHISLFFSFRVPLVHFKTQVLPELKEVLPHIMATSNPPCGLPRQVPEAVSPMGNQHSLCPCRRECCGVLSFCQYMPKQACNGC